MHTALRYVDTLVLAAVVMFVTAGCKGAESNAPSSLAGLSISQTHIVAGQAFSILLPTGHPKKMGVFTPDDLFYILHGQEEGVLLWGAAESVIAKKLEIDPRTLAGVTWVEVTYN